MYRNSLNSLLRQMVLAQPIVWETLNPNIWQALPAYADQEGVAPLVYQRFQQTGWPAAIPTATRLALAQAYYASAGHALLALRELARVLHTWQLQAALPNPLPVIVLKGAAVATTLYAAQALRPFGDVDVLLLPEHLAQLTQVVQALGYRASLPLNRAEVRAAVEHATDWRSPDGRVVLELHWNLIAGVADWRSPPVAWFWGQTEPWQPPRTATGSLTPLVAYQLNPTAQLLYLAAHLALQHTPVERRLIWFYDLHLLISQRNAAIDWPLVRQQAETWAWWPMLSQVLQSLPPQWGTPVPAEVLAWCAPSDLFTPKVPRSRLAYVWHKWQTLQGPARWRWGWDLLFPTPAYLQARYQPRPAWLWPLFYFYRWAIAVAEMGRAVWRR